MSEFKKVSCEAEYPDSIWYKTTCACGDNNMTLWFTIREEILALYFTVSANVPYYGEGNWFVIFWKRLRAAIRCLFGYELEYHEELIFSDHEHVRDFIGALKEGLEKTREWSQSEGWK